MALVTLLGSLSFTTTGGSKIVTATPTIGDLIFIVTAHTNNNASVAPTDSQGGVYEVVASATKTATDALQVWVRTSRIASAASTDFTHAPGTTTGGGLAVLRVDGLRESGASTVRQVGTTSDAGSGTPSVTLSSNINTNNAVLTALFNFSNPVGVSAPSGHTTPASGGYISPETGLLITTRPNGVSANTVTWGSASTAYGAVVVELDNQPFPVLNTENDPVAQGNLRGKYVECGFVSTLAAGLMLLATSSTIHRGPLETPIFRSPYLQTEQVVNPLTSNLAVVGVGAPALSLSDWPTPSGYRYYAQTDIPGSIFEPEEIVNGALARAPLTVQIYRKPFAHPQFYRTYSTAVAAPAADPLPPHAVDLTDVSGYRPYRQQELFRAAVYPTQQSFPKPIGSDGPFLLWDWPVPERRVDVAAYTFDAPNVAIMGEEFVLAFDDFEIPDPPRYFPQPDQVRNIVILEGVVTPLFEIRNIEWVVPTRKIFYEVQLYNNLALRDQVVTPLFDIRHTEWYNPTLKKHTYHDTVPNLLLARGLPTALYPIVNHDHPVPTRGRRYFAQPDPVPNSLIREIPGVPYLDIPLANLDWPIVYRAEMDWDAHFISERTPIEGSVPLSWLTFTATDYSILYGESTTLNWSSEYLTSLTASGGWSGVKPYSGSEIVGPLYVTTVYSLYGTSADQNHTATITINVTPLVNIPSGSNETRPAGRIVLEPKLAGHRDVVTFDFISALAPGETIATQLVTCTVYSGFDSSVSSMVVGPATASGTRVSQMVGGGVAGVVYDLNCTVTTADGNRLSMAAYLAVIPNRSQTMSAGRRVWIPKKQGETVTVPFDFVSDLQPSETIVSSAVVASLYSGVDAAPSSIIGGSPTISGTKVYQNVTAGVTGCIYSLLCRAVTSTGQVLELPLYVTIQPNIP